MASGYPGRDDIWGALRFGVESTGGLLKRSLTTEQEAQNAVFVRSVKQKNHVGSPISFLSPTSIQSSLSSASSLRGHGNLKVSCWSFPAAIPVEPEKKSTITSRLQQLERQLFDDEDDEFSMSNGSAMANSEWSETMQKLISTQKPLSNSPTSSSSSSSSSLAASSRQMLLDTATAISVGNLDSAAANLSFLKSAANKLGSPEQRLTAMMVTALALRINPRDPATLAVTSDIFTPEHLTSSQMLYEASPCFKLALMTANLAILEATNEHPKIHIIDFDVGQGLQLASLLHSLAERHRHLSVKITAFCDPSFPFNSLAGNLSLVGDRLAKLAEGLGIVLTFSTVNRRITELDRAALNCEEEEVLVVNFAFLLSRIADESVSPANPRDELLRRVKALGPKVITLVEQDMNGNTAPFATRFAEACAHYGALLESMEAIIAGRQSSERVRVEACLARKACNSVAWEGADRVERCELYGKWKARLGMAGFRQVQLGPGVVESIKLRLASLGNNPGFMVKEEDGRVGCGWMGRVISVASAWH
uniref:Scarecrow-like protein 8-like transcript variant X1 n=1 Tax=Cymbidium ensifolium TaxID=78740 RepID=A0A3G2CI15_CYMEN|nr:scarecrow-like protein 8-like transcript variant X1 [Cymbidium ensifolium]